MSELKVLEDEITSIEELLKVHSFHLYALRELRDKMQGNSPVQVEVQVDQPVAKEVSKKKSRKKTTKHGLYSKAAVYARKVGLIVRTDNVNKLTAIRRLIIDEQLPIADVSMQAMLTPSYIGIDTYNRAFRGTKYVKQA